jgi:hypothetical protein
MEKMYKKFLFIYLMGFSILACNDDLNIEPEQAISIDVALSSEEGIKTALIGVYSLLLSEPLFTGNVLLNSELLMDEDNLLWTSYITDVAQFLNKQIAAGNIAVEAYWVTSYKIINQINNILDAVEEINLSETSIITSEAKFLRGLIYFDLVNTYAKAWNDGTPMMNHGVPLITHGNDQNLGNVMIPRSTVTEVYDFILDDLKFAKDTLPEDNGFYASTYAASAILSRVFLMQEDFEAALKECNYIINSEKFNLLPEVAQAFNSSTNTIEDIFAIQVTIMNHKNHLAFFYGGEFEGGNGFIGISDEHMNRYEAGDERSNLFYLDKQSGTRRTSKWKENAATDGNITLIRLAEIYLTRAEARYRLGDIEGAMEDINVIRNRVGLQDLDSTNMSLEIILKERFIELAFEGHQYRDAKRTQKSVRGLPYNASQLIYPIPERELKVNENLIQNDGY